MKIDVIIIGGGAAGLTAALSASGKNCSCLVLEAAPRIGRKLLATGNGRCNLANLRDQRYYGCRALAQGALNRCPPQKVLGFFEGLGLLTYEEEAGRVYPACGQAAAVLDVLRDGLDRQQVQVLCDAKAERIEKEKEGFAVTLSGGAAYHGKSVVVACGGMAGGKLGHDGAAYGLLTGLGHSMVEPMPALSQIISDKKAVKGLSGLRLPARLTLACGHKPYAASQGEVLFTDYGISGVCAMQLSREAGELLQKGKYPTVYVDFSPLLGLLPRIYDRVEPENPFASKEKVLAFLEKRQHMLRSEGLLTGLLPRLLAQRLRNLPLDQMAGLLSAFPVPVIGIRGFENAQVTSGGLSGKEFSPETMGSLLCPGVYAAGEIMDVDGDCGGYNLMFAFASGLIAGEEAAKWAVKRGSAPIRRK